MSDPDIFVNQKALAAALGLPSSGHVEQLLERAGLKREDKPTRLAEETSACSGPLVGDYKGWPHTYYRWRADVVVPILKSLIDSGLVLEGSAERSRMKLRDLLRKHGYRWVLHSPDGRPISLLEAEHEVARLEQRAHESEPRTASEPMDHEGETK